MTSINTPGSGEQGIVPPPGTTGVEGLGSNGLPAALAEITPFVNWKEAFEKPSPAVLERFKKFQAEAVGIPVKVGSETRGYLFTSILTNDTFKKIPILVLVTDNGKVISYRTNTEMATKKAVELAEKVEPDPINLPVGTTLAELEKKFTSSIDDKGFGLSIDNSSDKGDSPRQSAIKDYKDSLKEALARGKTRQLERLKKSEAEFLAATDSILPLSPSAQVATA